MGWVDGPPNGLQSTAETLVTLKLACGIWAINVKLRKYKVKKVQSASVYLIPGV